MEEAEVCRTKGEGGVEEGGFSVVGGVVESVAEMVVGDEAGVASIVAAEVLLSMLRFLSLSMTS